MLLFGREPQRFLLTSEVKCLHFHGVEVRKPIPSYQVYRGTLFELVDQALDFVLSKINRIVGTRAAGPSAPVEYELPRDVVAEAIVNAVAHRDYASNASVQVMLFTDRLEVWNPGELPSALTLEDLRRPHASIPRNPLIAESLFLGHYAEKAGTGILDMIARCREEGLPTPEFHQSSGQFVQTVRRPIALANLAHVEAHEAHVEATPETHATLTAIERVIMEACAITPRSTPELLSALGHGSRTGGYKKAVARLLSVGFLELTVPDRPRSRNQRYRLTPAGELAISRNTARGGERS